MAARSRSRVTGLASSAGVKFASASTWVTGTTAGRQTRRALVLSALHVSPGWCQAASLACRNTLAPETQAISRNARTVSKKRLQRRWTACRCPSVAPRPLALTVLRVVTAFLDQAPGNLAEISEMGSPVTGLVVDGGQGTLR